MIMCGSHGGNHIGVGEQGTLGVAGGTAGLVDTIILCERKGKIGAVRWLRCLIGGQFILGGQRTPRGKFLEAALTPLPSL